MTEGLVVEGVKVVAGVVRPIFLLELYDFELLFFADVELIDKFVVYFHKFFLKDLDLLFVVAALRPAIFLAEHLFVNLYYDC